MTYVTGELLSFCHGETAEKLLSDEQWELIGPLFPEPRRRKDNRRRPWAANRACLEGIL